jgi:small GTP-binding protein
LPSNVCSYFGRRIRSQTYLTRSFYHGNHRQNHIPTVFDNIVVEVEVDGKTTQLDLWDTAGDEELDRLHCLQYPDSDIVFLCFSIDSPQSLPHITTKYLAQLKHYCHRGTPYILVGCKSDTRYPSRCGNLK